MIPRLLLVLLSACAAHAEFLRIEVYMSDMNCPSCSDSLGKAFEKMRGVRHVDVSIDKGTVALELAEGNRVALEQVWDTIKRIGFTPGRTRVTVRGEVKGGSLKISVLEKTVAIEGQAAEGESVELKGSITPPPDPRTPMTLKTMP